MLQDGLERLARVATRSIARAESPNDINGFNDISPHPLGERLW